MCPAMEPVKRQTLLSHRKPSIAPSHLLSYAKLERAVTDARAVHRMIHQRQLDLREVALQRLAQPRVETVEVRSVVDLLDRFLHDIIGTVGWLLVLKVGSIELEQHDGQTRR